LLKQNFILFVIPTILYKKYTLLTYSINDIEKLSGVKAHTIRIWEKRYNIIPNRRSESNIRFYEEDDLQLILNIAHLNKRGIKISKIATMSHDQIKQKIADYCDVDVIFENHIDGLMLSMFELNEYKFLKILNHHIKDIGFEKTMDEVIYPLLDKLSVMWIAGSVKGVHENFINNIIRRKLSVEIDKIELVPEECKKKFLIYLPEYEAHELSLLYVFFLLKKYGADTLYLGTQISINDVADAVEIYKPDYIFTLFNDSFSETPLQPYLNNLQQLAGKATVLVSGYQTLQQKIELPKNMELLNSLNEVSKYILTPKEA
jgi:MerR family transcriptional regulator, light-induced transcriptional regulator